jgi:hypothetical protein
MNKLVIFVVVVIVLVGTALTWNLMEATAVSSKDVAPPAVQDQLAVQSQKPMIQSALAKANSGARVSLAHSSEIQALGQPPSLTNTPASPVEPTNTPASPVEPTNTPAPPKGDAGSVAYQAPAALAMSAPPAQPGSGQPVGEVVAPDDDYVQWARQHAQALRQAGKRVQSPGALAGSAVRPLSSTATQQCVQTLLNPQMDVVEFGDGTGSIDYWSIMWQNIYYDTRAGYYNSPAYALAMADDPSNDTNVVSSTLDYDEFGQGFQSPAGLQVITVTYSTLYNNANSADTAYGNLWTLDSQGYLDQLILYWTIGGGTSWTNRYVSIADSGLLSQLAGKPLAFTFDMLSNRASPYEMVWLDDTQVTVCYAVGANKTYLPIVIKDHTVVIGPTCTPVEPDDVSHRGSTTVGASCSGSFSATDVKDYYSLNLNGATKIRLQLSNLPEGTNWDAMIYEDAAGYPLACHIGTPGNQTKYKDCTLSLSKNYFVLVSAGTAPSGGGTSYTMSVTPR